jgi:hypothetical protein
MDSPIAAVIANGSLDAGVFNLRTCPNFRVPYNGGPLGGPNGTTQVSPQGIITAYASAS